MSDQHKANDVLEARFTVAKNSFTDIHEHLDLLRQLASECEHVTELGMRGANGSTVAFLAAQPKKLISWDLNPWAIVAQSVADLLACQGRTSFEPRVGNTLEITIEQTDLLFIDTLHTARQLRDELERHGFCARKYIAFHDTATFGMKGEDGSEPGLRQAIRKFQKEHAFPIWKLIHDLPNCNGLVVLENSYKDQPEQWAKVLAKLEHPGVPR